MSHEVEGLSGPGQAEGTPDIEDNGKIQTFGKAGEDRKETRQVQNRQMAKWK